MLYVPRRRHCTGKDEDCHHFNIFGGDPPIGKKVAIVLGMRVMLGVLVGVSLMLQGCLLLLGSGAGAGAMAWVRGEFQATHVAPLNRTWDAALGALKDLAIPVKTTKKDELGGTIEATRADGKAVEIKLEEASSRVTVVKIRVGMFGDEDASKAINRRIGERLGIRATQ